MDTRNVALASTLLVCCTLIAHVEAFLPHLYENMLGGFGHHLPFMLPSHGYGGYGNPYGMYHGFGGNNMNKGYYGYKHPYLSAEYPGPFVRLGGKSYVPDPHKGHYGGFQRDARNTHKLVIQDESTKDSDYSTKSSHLHSDDFIKIKEFEFGGKKDSHPHGHIFRKIVEYDFSRAEPEVAEMAAENTEAMASHVMKKRSAVTLHDNIMDNVLYEITGDQQESPQKRGIYYVPKMFPYVPPVVAPYYYKPMITPGYYRPPTAYYMPIKKVSYYPIYRYRRDVPHDVPIDVPKTQHEVPPTMQLHSDAASISQHNPPPPPASHIKSEFQHNFQAPQLHSAPYHYPHRGYHVLPKHQNYYHPAANHQNYYNHHAKAADPTFHHGDDYHGHPPPHEYHHKEQPHYHHEQPNYHHEQPQYHHDHPQHFGPVYHHHDVQGKAAQQQPEHLLAAVNSQHSHPHETAAPATHPETHHQETSYHPHDTVHHDSSSPHHEAPHHETPPAHFDTSPVNDHVTPIPPVYGEQQPQAQYYGGGYDEGYRKSGDAHVKSVHSQVHPIQKAVEQATTPNPKMRIFHHLKRPFIHGHSIHSHHY